jgi:hypothetical protein
MNMHGECKLWQGGCRCDWMPLTRLSLGPWLHYGIWERESDWTHWNKEESLKGTWNITLTGLDLFWQVLYVYGAILGKTEKINQALLSVHRPYSTINHNLLLVNSDFRIYQNYVILSVESLDEGSLVDTGMCWCWVVADTAFLCPPKPYSPCTTTQYRLKLLSYVLYGRCKLFQRFWSALWANALVIRLVIRHSGENKCT